MAMRSKPVRVIILGTGIMARAHADAYKAIKGVEIVGAVDTREDVLTAFCEEHGIEHRFTSLEAAIEWGQFDSASNVTPDSAHYATTMSLLAAGKHVLCEKPLSTDHQRALEMADAARAAGVVNMVNLSYRQVPAMQQAARMIRDGAIGEIRHLEASYLQSWLTQSAWGEWSTEPGWLWRLSTKHGSKGVLGDVGIHILDYATYVAGQPVTELSCRLKTFDKAPGGQIGDYVLDANDSAVMHVGLANGAVGTVTATRFASGHLNDLALRVFGTQGGLEVLFEDNVSRLRACLGDDMKTGSWHDIDCPPVETNYKRFIDAVISGKNAEPSFARGAELQQLLDLAETSGNARALPMVVPPVVPSAHEHAMPFAPGE